MKTSSEYFKTLKPEIQKRIIKAGLKLYVCQAFYEGVVEGKRQAVNESIKAINKITKDVINGKK